MPMLIPTTTSITKTLKIIDRYLLKSYLTRLISVFAICMVIFVVQTFWLYIDELAGKGLSFLTISKFLIYFSPKLIPLVLPLSVLLAALMTYGNLAENYEFAAMKSTGISLQRALLGLTVFHILLGIGTFYFSNHVIPYGELKSYNLRRNLAKLEPTIAIREGIFNKIGDINIKVEKKYGESEELLEDVIIHEYLPSKKNNVVIKASRGELVSKENDANLQLLLFDGNRYESILNQSKNKDQTFPHAKVYFEKYVMNVDLSQFNNVDLEEEKYTSTFRMQKVDQLKVSIDSLQKNFNEERIIFTENFIKKGVVIKVVNEKKTEKIDSFPRNPYDLMESENEWKFAQVSENAINEMKSSLRELNGKKQFYFLLQENINFHKIAFHEKYTLMFASVFLFLIGASLGAIIRKGGLGLPLVLAILIFLTYHYIGLFLKNAAEDDSIPPLIATWLSTLILAPSAILLTLRASSDRGFVALDVMLFPWVERFRKLFKRFKKDKK